MLIQEISIPIDMYTSIVSGVHIPEIFLILGTGNQYANTGNQYTYTGNQYTYLPRSPLLMRPAEALKTSLKTSLKTRKKIVKTEVQN